MCLTDGIDGFKKALREPEVRKDSLKLEMFSELVTALRCVMALNILIKEEMTGGNEYVEAYARDVLKRADSLGAK